MINSFLRWPSIGLFLCFMNVVFSQTPNPNPNQEFKPQEVTVPKSPEVIGLYEFSPFPMDYSSGAANVDIPLHTVESGRIKLPISVSYHTGGIRVQDLASMIGLGWNLNFGYNVQVSEEETKIYGYETKLYKNESQALAATNRGNDWMNEMLNSVDGYYPSRHTIYDFNCGTFSGTFFYDDNDQLRLISPDYHAKIEAINYGPTANHMNGFKITSADGIEYVFNKRETAQRWDQSYPGSTAQTTAFWISQITDLISGDKVIFLYNDKDPYFDYQNESYALASQTNDITKTQCLWKYDSHNRKIAIPFQIKSLQIASIYFTGGYIDFSSVKDRPEIDKTRITDMRVYSNLGPAREIKNITFNQSYFSNGGYRLRLDSVAFGKYNSGSVNNSDIYRFEYDPIQLPSARSSYDGSERNCLDVDYWGFYNGSKNGTGLISKDVMQEWLSYRGWNRPLTWSTDRKANPLYTKACILNKVVYPTGGYARFEYENHHLPLYYLGSTLGGLRVKNIFYYTGTDDLKPIQKTYNYISAKELTPASKEMFLYSKIKTYVQNACDGDPYCLGLYNCYTPYYMDYISSNPLYPFVYHHGSPVFYDKVEEINGSIQENSGKSVYNFDFSSTAHNDYALSSIVENGGRKFIHTNDWTRGNLLSKEVYKKNDASSPTPYTIVSKEVNTYRWFSKGQVKFGMMISKNDHAEGKFANSNFNSWDLVGPEANNSYATESFGGRMPVDAFLYNDISSFISYPRLSKQETYNYVGNDSICSRTDYFYDSPFHELLTKKETYDSNNRINSTKYYYPKDLISEPLMPNLVAQNRVSSPVKTEQYLNGIKTSEEKTLYDFTTANLLLPKCLYSAKFPNSLPSLTNIGQLEQKMTYDLYDTNGKVLQYTPAGGVPTVVIWGYKKTLPIAKIENTTYASITPALISDAQTASDTDNENTLIAKLNNLRNAVPNAMITTYTYVPFIGVSSITDPKGCTTYYTYNNSNRLQYIKDRDLNVLQRYCYNYLGQIIDCPRAGLTAVGSYYNIAKSATFTKTPCATGLLGSSHLYSVPAGIYSSTVSQADADAQAINEIAINGQNFANTTGICGTIPLVPNGLIFISATSSSISFSWTAVTGATSYKIYKNGVYVSTVPTNTGSLSGLTASTAYSIQVLASNPIGDGVLCAAVSMTTTPVGPAAPTGLIFSSATATSINFSWSAVPGATAYKIYKNDIYVNTVTSTSGLLSGLTISTTYNIQVLSSNALADGPLSSIVAMSTLPSSPTGLTFVNCAASTLAFSWTTVAGATGYKIYKNGTYVSTVATTTGSLSGLIAATAYNIQVSAINASGEGALCTSVTMSTAPVLTPPAWLTIINATGSTLNFAWQVVPGATGYKIYKNGVFVSNATTNSGELSGLAGSTTYSVQISATYGSLEGGLSNSTSMTTASVPLATPGWVTVIETTGSTLKFAWEAISGATGYKIYKNGVFVNTATTNFIELTGLAASTTYSIQISATNGSVEGSLCAVRSMTTAAAGPAAPTGLTQTSATASSINFSWSAVTGASGYKIYKNGDYVSTVTTTTGSLSSLVPSTSYNVQVLTYNATVDGTLSNVVSMSTVTGSMGFYKTSGNYPAINGSSASGSILNKLTSPIYVYAVAQGSSGTGSVIINGITLSVSGGGNLASANYAVIAGGAIVPVNINYSGGGSLILAYSLAPGAPLTYWSNSNY